MSTVDEKIRQLEERSNDGEKYDEENVKRKT